MIQVINRVFILVGISLFLTQYSAAQTFIPVSVSGFNQDLIAEGAGGADRAKATTTITFDDNALGTTSDNVLYAKNFRGNLNQSTPPPFGLPDDGIIESQNLPGAVYHLASYDQNNALLLRAQGNSGTLVLATPGVFSKIAFLGASSNGDSQFDFVLNFSDGTSFSTPFTVPDWYFGANYAIKSIGRVYRTTLGAHQADEFNGDAENPRLYDNELTIDAPYNTKVLTSITITKTNTMGSTGIFAINGITAPNAPNAPIATAATNVTETGFTANWQTSATATGYFLDVSTNANFTSFVGVYNNFSVGNVLTQNITGLTAGTEYYYRVRAGNTWGVSPSSNTITVRTSDPACFVQIPDANFKAYLLGNTEINTNGDGFIQCTEAEAYSGSISCAFKSISDLTGIAAFVNISQLDCGANNITALDLSHNTKLNRLAAAANKLTSLNINNCALLQQIYCENNQLANLNISDNVALITLQLFGNKLTGINLNNNLALKEVYLQDNQITSVNVTKNTALNVLNLGNNKLYSLNLKNGNNTAFTFISAQNNAELNCITVDDPAYSTSNWTGGNFLFDAQHSFKTNCDEDLPGDLCENAVDIQNLFGHPIDQPQNSGTYSTEGMSAEGDPVTGTECLNTNRVTMWFKFNGDGFRYSMRSRDCGTKLYADPNGAMFSGVCSGLTPVLCHRDIWTGDVDPDVNFKISVQTSAGQTYYLLVEVTSTDDFITYDNFGDFCLEVTRLGEECVVNIPDANFKTYLIENTEINTNGDDEIQCDEATEFYGNIDCNTLGIADLTGIEAFVNLNALVCNNNQLTRLDVSKNTVMTTLVCHDNKISQLNLVNNTSLTGIDCSHNKLTTLDVSKLVGMNVLDCRYNDITSLDLSHNTGLTQLGCASNQLNYLNLANGINVEMSIVLADKNPELTCVQVDDPVYCQEHWTGSSFTFDEQSEFSTFCSPCTSGNVIAANFLIASSACVGDSFHIVDYSQIDTVDSSTHFTWDFGDGNSSTDRDPVITYTSPGQYTILLKLESNDCAFNVSKSVDVNACLIQYESEVQYANIYPNPVVGPSNVDIRLPVASDVAIKVFTINGEQVWAEFLKAVTYESRAMPQIPKGVYIVEIGYSYGTERYKLIAL